MSEQDLLTLLDIASERNKRQNVTGMVLYSGGNFIQALEGKEKDVDDIYQSILADDRNKGNIVIETEVLNKETFLPGLWDLKIYRPRKSH